MVIMNMVGVLNSALFKIMKQDENVIIPEKLHFREEEALELWK